MKLNANISFFKVPLICNIVPSIGCGSRSKPLLLDLEKHHLVNEAWLNRKGTLIAIVWKEQPNINARIQAVKPIFLKYNISLNVISNRKTKAFALEKINWLKGEEVNKLSKDEAQIVANQLINTYHKIQPLTKEQEVKLSKQIVEVFFDFFLNFSSFAQLSDTKEYRKLMAIIVTASEQYIKKNNIPKVEDLLKSCQGHSESCKMK